ncbi:ATP-binding protein [Rhizobium leguminosarum]|uniref:ATP-binding protein n=1 Tax=Rhizobium leguminosarum TaxID=384 RepID=UPI003D791571
MGVQAIEHHHKRVRFFSTVELVIALEQEGAGRSGQIADRLVHYDLVILDELGYPFSASGGAPLFHALSNSTSAAASSSPPTSASASGLTDDHGADRPPTHHCHTIETENVSIRFKNSSAGHGLASSRQL